MAGPIIDRFNKLIVCGNQSNAVRNRVNDYGGNIFGLPVQDGKGSFDIIERENDHIIQYALWCAVSQRHAVGLINIAPVCWVGRLAYFGKIVSAVVSAFGLGNLGRPV